ncbi:conjugal transfer family protein [Burkholderia pseudomallei ABCPW 1]|nr:conjugal transfer family protein [Burkholderia pseudomallei ABCPW 1]CRY44876.1 conjugal transfer protein TrbG/VirB9/CagX [Burkholderia pseudomallei]
MKRTRSLLSWGALALIAASANAFAAKNAANPIAPIPNFDVGSIIGDAMSPVNPYNSGADPITMPGDARMAVFSYSRDKIFRVMTAPLKLTTIELERGETLISEPAMGDSVQWVAATLHWTICSSTADGYNRPSWMMVRRRRWPSAGADGRVHARSHRSSYCTRTSIPRFSPASR